MSVHYDKGVVLYRQRRYDLAEAEFRKSLAEDPEDTLGHAMLAAALSAQGQSEKGIKEAQLAIKLNPEMGYPYYILSISQLAASRLPDAEKSIKEALRIDPTSTTYLNHAGEIALVKGNYKAALTYAEEALKEEPEDIESINTRAQALVKLGRYAEAEDSLDTALRLAPEDSATHSNKGWTLVRRGRIEEAIEHFKESLRLNPNSEWAYEGVVEALKARNPLYHKVLMGSLSMQEMNGNLKAALWWFCWIIPPLRALLVLMMFTTFCTKTLFTFLLRLDPLGRRVLTDTAKRRNNFAIAVVVFVFGCFFFVAASPWLFQPQTHRAAIAAQGLYEKGDKDGAMIAWQAIIKEALRDDKKGKHDDADNELRDVIEVMRDTKGVDQKFIFDTMMVLGKHHMEQKEFRQAENVYRSAYKYSLAFPSKVYRAMALFNQQQADLRQSAPDTKKIVREELKALQMFEEDGDESDPRFREMLHGFANTLRVAGNFEESGKIEARAKMLDATHSSGRNDN